MDDFVFNVRQVGDYPQATQVGSTDICLLQLNGLGGPYNWIKATDLVNSALGLLAEVDLSPNAVLNWGGVSLWVDGAGFEFDTTVNAPLINAGDVIVGGCSVATMDYVNNIADEIASNTVWSFNGRTGDVQLTTDDVRQAGGAPQTNPAFNGVVTAPTLWNPRDNSDSVATTAWVQSALCAWYEDAKAVGTLVTSFNGRGGDVVLNADDITVALTQPGYYGTANTPPLGDASARIATTLFVDNSLAQAKGELENEFDIIAAALDATYAPLNSPQFTGIPTAPTAAQTVNSGQLATTAFVHAAVTASTTGVSSFNTRTGAVVLNTLDITTAGGAPIANPTFTGIPAAPTATPGTSTTQLATTAFVAAAVGALSSGVTSFNTRTGAVTFAAADLTAVGGALLASPAFTGTPTAPTPAPTSNDATIATTAYVTNALAALPALVSSFNGRTGAVTFQASDVSAVGGALLASPAFTGTPTAPTQPPATSNTTLATTAFVNAAMSSVVAGVSSFNTRTGAVTLLGTDITAAGGALLAGPTFTGVPAAPTATAGTNSTQIATTAFVQAALSAAPGGVSSFNGRTGAITFLAADVSAVGGALLANPNFTGAPTAPTPSPGDHSTNIATTQFVATAIATGGGVSSFNGRAGVVTLTSSDVNGASGAIYVQADTAPTGTPQTLWFNSLNGQLYVQYKDPSTSALSWVIANSPTPPPVVPTGILNIQVFKTAGTATYTPTSGMGHCVVECVGGGAGGFAQTGATTATMISGGGGAGGYSKKFLTAGAIGSSQTVTVGAGGAGASGGAGGDTSFGTLCIAKGAPLNPNWYMGGPGGSTTGAVGDITSGGAPGIGGAYTQPAAGTGVTGGQGYSGIGQGGSGPFGGGAAGIGWTTTGPGNNATGPGSGGGGACWLTSATVQNGGNGAAGICIVTEYA